MLNVPIKHYSSVTRGKKVLNEKHEFESWESFELSVRHHVMAISIENHYILSVADGHEIFIGYNVLFLIVMKCYHCLT